MGLGWNTLNQTQLNVPPNNEDYGFYINRDGDLVTECSCGSFLVFRSNNTSLSKLCFRCGEYVERPIIERKPEMTDIDSERSDEPDDLEELNKNEVDDYKDEENVKDVEDAIDSEKEF